LRSHCLRRARWPRRFPFSPRRLVPPCHQRSSQSNLRYAGASVDKDGCDERRNWSYCRNGLADAQHERRVVACATQKRGERQNASFRLGCRLAGTRTQNQDHTREMFIPRLPEKDTGALGGGFLIESGRVPSSESFGPTEEAGRRSFLRGIERPPPARQKKSDSLVHLRSE
jgi:hypothetical protein